MNDDGRRNLIAKEEQSHAKTTTSHKSYTNPTLLLYECSSQFNAVSTLCLVHKFVCVCVSLCAWERVCACVCVCAWERVMRTLRGPLWVWCACWALVFSASYTTFAFQPWKDHSLPFSLPFSPSQEIILAPSFPLTPSFQSSSEKLRTFDQFRSLTSRILRALLICSAVTLQHRLKLPCYMFVLSFRSCSK